MNKFFENIEFTKMHGTGNDFILVVKDNLPTEINLSELSKYACNRRFGAGSDGLLILAGHDEADFEMIFYNPDGSLAEMCGNGIRCLGKFIYEHGFSKQDKLRIKTGVGILPIKLEINESDLVFWVIAAMGYPDFTRKNIPVAGDGELAMAETIKLQSGLELEFHAVSLGNPHAVLFVDDVANYPVREIGSELETHEMFPNRINTEFVQHISSEEIQVRIWERGAGETMSCGTGVCAAAAVCRKLGVVRDELVVHVPGGDLKINFDENEAVYLGGPAVEVYRGKLV